MPRKLISRRRFIESSMLGGLALGFPWPSQSPASAQSSDRVSLRGLSLQIAGDASQGYSVALLFDGRPVARHHRGGEFSALFQNQDRSVEDRVEDWKATSWKGEDANLTLRGSCTLPNLGATVFVEVSYQLLGPALLRKQIRLRQSDMFLLFYQLTNCLEPRERPAKLWSFDQLDWQGGTLHEYFPAAGFRTSGGVCVGLLTDSGYRNQWTRFIRRDGRPVKPAPRRVPDADLYSGSAAADNSGGEYFVQQTFGELLEELDAPQSAQRVALPASASWKIQGQASLGERDGYTVLSTPNSDHGALIPFDSQGSQIYSLRMEYRSPAPVALEIWNVNKRLEKAADLTLYNDALPESPAAWRQFQTTVFVPGLQGFGKALFLSLAPSEQAETVRAAQGLAEIEIRNLRLERLATRTAPYHRLEMDRPAEKNVFVFADRSTPDSIRGHRLASQLYLAQALGFRGGQTESIVFADLMMLCWIAGPETFRPMVAPSIWYSAAGEMYLRDSFFALNGVHSRELNEGVFNSWADNQGEDGAINTLVEPNLANLERKSNDSTPLWLMWALLNRRRFSTQIPVEKLRRAAEYCLRAYDPSGDGLCHANFVMGQLDVIRYPQGTTAICENQGMLAVTLRVIKELAIPGVSDALSDERMARAEQFYRSYYDPQRKFMRPARDISDAIGFADIFPEFLSLWLFNKKLLSSEMVLNHLDRIPVMMPRSDCPYPQAGGSVRPIFIGLPKNRAGWSYFDQTWHPMISDSFARGYARHAMDGIYYNGGSWMRIEICGYVTGLLHGWAPARPAIANRLWAEVNIAPEFPTSQEYLATDGAHPFFGFHRVFAWNSFVLQALELAGLRTADMDPTAAPK